MTVLRGECYWANIRKPNSMSGKLQMDVGNLDKDSKKVLKDHDIPLKNKGDERGDYVTLKGDVQYPPKVTDSQGNPLPEPVRLGNGSKVKVEFNPYEWEFKGKVGWSAGLRDFMVLDLVEYVSADKEDLEPEDGYVVGGTTTDPDLNDESPI